MSRVGILSRACAQVMSRRYLSRLRRTARPTDAVAFSLHCDRESSRQGATRKRRLIMMRRKILLPLLGAGMLVCLATSASAQGVLDNQRTFFTFSAPVALPGVTLPAGKYEFRL